MPAIVKLTVKDTCRNPLLAKLSKNILKKKLSQKRFNVDLRSWFGY